MTLIRSELIGFGHCLPQKVVTNDDLAKMVDTNDEWIRTRTGIVSRHISEGETTSDIAFKAAQMAIESAGITVDELDMIIVATLTPDNTIPAVAAKLSNRLGAKSGTICTDIAAACSGFVYALTFVDNMIQLGQIKTALVIGAETLSNVVDWTDRNTCVLFGDGAGAAVVRAKEGQGNSSDTGILATKLYADGSHYDNLKIMGGVSTTRTAGFVTMDGKEVFKFAVNALSQAAEVVMEKAGVSIEDVDFIIPHQANIRIIEGVSKKLNVSEEKVIVTVDHHGNTSAASIPLALSENYASGRIKKGDLVVLTAMGAGFTWGGILVRI